MSANLPRAKTEGNRCHADPLLDMSTHYSNHYPTHYSTTGRKTHFDSESVEQELRLNLYVKHLRPNVKAGPHMINNMSPEQAA
jgi:hypothetical protein